ncbi:MAG: hypothetical protein IJT43_03720 [Stomatobaculum sp.]|nr:hypothetical protein [Stomatobaculum sp.]
MKAYSAEDLRIFTQALFTRDSFDSFLVLEAEFRTYCLFSVRGNAERGWYTDEELETEQVEDYTSWKKLRPVCFGLIRGKRTPLSFKITFRLPPAEEEKLLLDSSGGTRIEELGGFFLNLKFEDGKLLCVSAASINRFPPDRVLEEAWDRWTERFFRERELAVREL